MANHKAKLTLNNGAPIELNVLPSTLGQNVIDIRNLGSKGIFSFDPGFISTAACESKITFIDGNKGILLYRGFPIEQLATRSNYLEVCYILLYGEKPTPIEFNSFKTTIIDHSTIQEQITRFFHVFPNNSHPMAIICGTIAAMAAFYHNVIDVHNPCHRELAVFHLLSKMPIITAMCYKHLINQPFIQSRSDLSYASNFLNMMFSTPHKKHKLNPVLERAMDRILILHADHEQNASTSTVRMAGSSGANPFACIAAGIASLWGPAHGGANEAALKMLEKISSIEHIPEYIRRAKDKNDPFRLMGFGHRIYKNYDPRATVLRETCHEVLKELGSTDNLLKVALELEKIALNDSYFIEKKLYPNIDFYSGIILKAMGIPTSMFTVIFAMARTAGWIAHWNEMHNEKTKIARPRQLYTGYKQRDFKSKN